MYTIHTQTQARRNQKNTERRKIYDMMIYVCDIKNQTSLIYTCNIQEAIVKYNVDALKYRNKLQQRQNQNRNDYKHFPYNATL